MIVVPVFCVSNFVYFKQKTSYVMRISDWISDVCSSDLTDALKILRKVGLTKMTTFPVNRGKQLIAASPDGYLIGDGIVFHLEQDYFRVVGPPVISDWTQFHAETGGYDVEIDRDETVRSEEHTSELQSLMRNSYAVFCLKKKNNT